jgi:hypothetical protein
MGLKLRIKSSIHLMMRQRKRTILFILMALVAIGIDHASAAGGPHLVASLVNGTLQTERPGAIWIEIKNDANASAIDQMELGQQLPIWLQGNYGTNATDAIGIAAELQSKDSRIRMLSGPQLAGSLAAGNSRTLEFNALANGMAQPGVYPMDLTVAYQRLSNFTILGDPEQPDIAFQYQNTSESIPVNINVILGPLISVEDNKESAIPGKASTLDIVFFNRGDISASDIHIKVLNETPFRSSDGSMSIGTLEPGASTSSKIGIETENGTAPGVYALQFDVSYHEGSMLQNEELAAIVTVSNPPELNSMLASAAGVLLLALAAYLAFRLDPKRFGKKKKW